MARQYNLACPVARALDVLGDRWTLLIVRDLHAGPARFTDLDKSLTGLAPNLLIERLRTLEDVGMVLRRDGAHSVVLYELTASGRATSPVLFELAKVGVALPVPEDLERLAPGNLRHLAVVLEQGANAVAPDGLDLRAGMVMDGEPFSIIARNGVVTVRYEAVTDPDVVIASSYDSLIAAIEQRISPEELSKSVELVEGTPERQAQLRGLIWGALGSLLPS